MLTCTECNVQCKAYTEGYRSRTHVYAHKLNVYSGTSFIEILEKAEVEISMDGKGRWRDNVFIERLWRSLKYECVYLHEFEDGRQARQTIADWLRYYNEDQPHSSLAGNRTPMEAYTGRKAA